MYLFSDLFAINMKIPEGSVMMGVPFGYPMRWRTDADVEFNPNLNFSAEYMGDTKELVQVNFYHAEELFTYRWINPKYFQEIFEQETTDMDEVDSWTTCREYDGTLIYYNVIVSDLSQLIEITNSKIGGKEVVFTETLTRQSFMDNYLPYGVMIAPESDGTFAGSKS